MNITKDFNIDTLMDIYPFIELQQWVGGDNSPLSFFSRVPKYAKLLNETKLTEAMFQEGQVLPHAYHRSKFESEKRVRESDLDYRIYRPSSVVGDSISTHSLMPSTSCSASSLNGLLLIQSLRSICCRPSPRPSTGVQGALR